MPKNDPFEMLCSMEILRKLSSRFNISNFGPMPLALKESGLSEKGGVVVLGKEYDGTTICKILYLDDFKIVSLDLTN